MKVPFQGLQVPTPFLMAGLLTILAPKDGTQLFDAGTQRTFALDGEALFVLPQEQPGR